MKYYSPDTSTIWKRINCMQFQSYDMCSSMLSLKVIVIIIFPEKYTVKDHISNTKLEKGNHCYIQTRHKDLFSY